MGNKDFRMLLPWGNGIFFLWNSVCRYGVLDGRGAYLCVFRTTCPLALNIFNLSLVIYIKAKCEPGLEFGSKSPPDIVGGQK